MHDTGMGTSRVVHDTGMRASRVEHVTPSDNPATLCNIDGFPCLVNRTKRFIG